MRPFLILKSRSPNGPQDPLLILKKGLPPEEWNYSSMLIFVHSNVPVSSLEHEMRYFIWTASSTEALLEPTHQSVVGKNSPCQPAVINLISWTGCNVDNVLKHSGGWNNLPSVSGSGIENTFHVHRQDIIHIMSWVTNNKSKLNDFSSLAFFSLDFSVLVLQW